MQVLASHDAPIPAAGHADINRVVGRFAVRYLDREDGVTYTLHQQFVTGGGVGARAGYESLGAAVADLRLATAREAAAAVVVERDGRYFGRTLKVRDLERGLRAPLEALHLEADERVAVRELRVVGTLHERVRAIVDGGWDRRFRADRA